MFVDHLSCVDNVEPLRCWQGQSELVLECARRCAASGCGRGGTVIKAGRKQVIVRADVWAENTGAEPLLVAVAQATIVPV